MNWHCSIYFLYRKYSIKLAGIELALVDGLREVKGRRSPMRRQWRIAMAAVIRDYGDRETGYFHIFREEKKKEKRKSKIKSNIIGLIGTNSANYSYL